MAKTSKIAKAPKSFKSYALNKCLIGYGVVNGIINAAMEICLVCTASVQLRYFTRVQRGI